MAKNYCLPKYSFFIEPLVEIEFTVIDTRASEKR